MPDTFKVTQVTRGEEYPYTPPGSPTIQLVPYDLLLEGPGVPNEEVQLNQVPDSPAPTVGQEIFGNLSKTKHGWRLKKVNPDFAGGSQQRSNGSLGQQSMSPERERSIERQSVAKACGGTFAALTRTDGWRTTFAADVRFIVDAVHDAVRGE